MAISTAMLIGELQTIPKSHTQHARSDVACTTWWYMQETARNTVPPEKQVVSQLVRHPAFYGKRRFITVFTTARHVSRPSANQHRPHIFNLFLFSHVDTDMQSRHFRSGFLPKLWNYFSSLRCVLHVPQSHPLYYHYANIVLIKSD